MSEQICRERGRVITKFARDVSVPPWVLKLPVSRDARLSAVYLLSYQQSGDSSIIERLMEDLSVKLAAARRYLGELSEVGVLDVQRKGIRVLYFMYSPDMIPTDHGTPHSDALKRPNMIPTDHVASLPTVRSLIESLDMIPTDHGTPHSDALKRPNMIPTDHVAAVATVDMIPTDHGASRPNALKRPNMIPTDHVAPHVVVDSISPSESQNQNRTTTTSAQPDSAELTPLFWWLKERGVFAAREFMHLDFAAATADFERKRADGMHPGAIVNAWRVSPPTPGAIAAIEPKPYTSEWFAWIRVHKPEIAQLYRLGSDEDGLDDDQADDDSLATDGDDQ